MTCPSCQESLSRTVIQCPHCGARIVRMQSGVIKTSAVLIASDDMQAIYPSLRDVPEPLRRRVVECTSGRNSGTIVIADRRGKEEIERAARIEQTTSSKRAAPKRTAPLCEASPARARVPIHRVWPALVALIVGAAGAWVAFVIRW